MAVQKRIAKIQFQIKHNVIAHEYVCANAMSAKLTAQRDFISILEYKSLKLVFIHVLAFA